MRYTKEQYLNCGFYGVDREGDEKLYSSDIVKCRKDWECAFCGQPIKAGSHAMVERAIVYEMWCTSYTCLQCLEKWIDDSGQLQNVEEKS